MVWGVRASIWFGIALAALIFFAWCVVELTEREEVAGGFIWGIILSGAIGIFAGAVAIVAQMNAGGVAVSYTHLTLPTKA